MQLPGRGKYGVNASCAPTGQQAHFAVADLPHTNASGVARHERKPPCVDPLPRDLQPRPSSQEP
jgi:hypothetical protein